MKSSPLHHIRNSVLALTAVLAFAGCSSTSNPPLQVDRGPIHPGTFNFVANKASAAAQRGDRGERRKFVHGAIQETITENLTAKGFKKVDGQAEVAVAYLVVIGNGAATLLVDDYFGLGREGEAIGNKAHDASGNVLTGVNYSEAGLLVIDLVDPATSKVLKRSSVVRPVLRNAPEELRKEHIQEAVTEALKDLQVSK